MASLVQVFLAGLLLVGIAVAAPQGSFGYTSEAPAYDPPQDPTSSFGGSFQDQSNPAPEEPAFSPVFQDQSAHETSAQVSFSHSAQPHSPSSTVTDHPLSTQGDDSSSFSAHGQTDDHDDTERSFGEDGDDSDSSPVTEADTLSHPFSSFHNPHSSFN